MDKSLLIFAAIGIGALYLVTNFMGDIQEEDTYKNNDYKVEHKYDKYQSVDSVGQSILSVNDMDEKTQIAAWQASPVKIEFLELFPNYSEMKIFVKDRVRGNIIQKKLLTALDKVEGKFFSGALNSEQAKQALDSLK